MPITETIASTSVKAVSEKKNSLSIWCYIVELRVCFLQFIIRLNINIFIFYLFS